ncbi:hypothetical protein HII31_10171 [Pseudocercospora fuligena]|uniref:Uncharacterized protein n=1 Tax=Pseudocercospora fuligena TaxID=685502 RepID=A0A8H6RCN1_9PEZI|nr:hypothetical protein HII31_10171 [Pseudocercospora fuligena]
MSSLTPVLTRLLVTTDSAKVPTTITEIGEVPLSQIAWSQFTSSAWHQFTEALPTSIQNEATDLEDALYLAEAATGAAVTSIWDNLPTQVSAYLYSVYWQEDPSPSFTTQWRQISLATPITSQSGNWNPIDVEKPSAFSAAQEQQYQRVLTVAIALPVCLVTIFLLLGCLLWWQRHRIVQDLNRRYFGPNFNAPSLNYGENKRWSAENSPSTGTPLSDLPIRACDGNEGQRLDHSSSGRRTPDNPLRALGTTNFPRPKQHFLEKPRCITPDTPSGRREQLESRAQLIQDVHQRVREGSITPDLLSPRRVVSLDRVNEERIELERPSSPTGSIRVVEAAHIPRRAASDAIRSRLDEVFQPDWRPESASGSYT